MAYFKPYEPKRRFKQKRDQRGAHYSSKKTGWRRKRLWFIRRHPLCAHCLSERGLRVKAVDVDHIIPLAEGGDDDFDNLQALCKSCHSRKTAREQRDR